jgi:hypothetical protein
MVKKRKPKKLTTTPQDFEDVFFRHKRPRAFEPELIVAHLLGGTSGLNLEVHRTPQDIQMMVQQGVDVMREIVKQCSEL